MKTVAIVSEYNPFHKGHKYQLERIKKDFGEDVCIVSVMSGNYVQRGDMAILDKFTRARIAVTEGVSLVLELPFPFSMQSAELFAASAIRIICGAVKADAISFGCECDDSQLLHTVAQRLLSVEYTTALEARLQNKELKSTGYPRLCESTYKELYNDELGARALTSPNNILGIEYIKSLIREDKSIDIHAIKRLGAEHNQLSPSEDTFSSSSAIRSLLFNMQNEEALRLLPNNSRKICEQAMKENLLPVNINRLSNAFLAFLRINDPRNTEIAFDTEGGLAHRLHKFSMQAKDLNELITLVSTKRYTTSRIRRALINLYFGITSSDVKSLPKYTQILAMDKRGREKLKEMKVDTEIEILTKPADYVSLSDIARSQAEISHRADSVFSIAKPISSFGDEFLRASPFCKK